MDIDSGPGIVIIGAGNVALQLGRRFVEMKYNVLQIVNRDISKAKSLAGLLITDYTDDINKINTNAEVYIICVSDSAIDEVGSQLQSVIKNKLVVHTSGAISSQVLEKYFTRCGVFYPLQSFSHNTQPDFNKVPICVFSKDKEDLIFLLNLANGISNTVEILTDEQRLVLHLSAVFVNNFSNHLFTLADSILKDYSLSFKLLIPLIEETVNKIHQNAPGEMQTGPAQRGDLITINKHLELLKSNPLLEKIYLDLSKSINPKLNL